MVNKLPKQKVALDLIQGKIKPYDGFSNLKFNLDLESLELVVNQVLNIKNRSNEFILKGLLPKKYSELFSAPLLRHKANSLERELFWMALLLKRHAPLINTFVSLKNDYEVEIINGNYERAAYILKNIEKDICYSSWSLQSRFLLKEYMTGLEGNKEFLNEINSIEGNDLLLWIADIFSYKVEKKVTDPQYRNRMNKLISRISNQSLSSYFKEKIYGMDFFTQEESANILYCEQKSSIVDRYLTFILICQITSANNSANSKICKMIKRCLGILGTSINDKMLKKLRLFLIPEEQEREEIQEEDRILGEIGHLYTVGEYQSVIEKCSNMFEQHANYFEIYEYYVKSLLHTGKTYEKKSGSLKSLIINDMYNAYIKRPDSIVGTFHNLARLARTLNYTGFGISLVAFGGNRFSITKTKEVTIIAELNSMNWNPRFCLVYTEISQKVNYLQNCRRLYGDYSHIRLFMYYYDLLEGKNEVTFVDDIPESRKQWYNLKAKIHSGEIEKPLEKLWILYNEAKEQICKVNYDIQYYNYEKIVIVLLELLLEANKNEDFLNLYINIYLENKYMTARIDAKKIYEQINSNLTREIKSNISLPILAHICKQNQTIELYTACANFLDFNNIVKPTDLLNKTQEYDIQRLIYFLRYVCIPGVLDLMYWNFESEDQVDNERIEICRFLRGADPINDSIYVSEISLITQKYSLTKRIQILDDSKIDIDLRKIRDGKHEIFSENYKRYIDIGNFDISYNILDMNNSKVLLVNYFSNNDHNAIIEKKNQKYVLFKEFFNDYRDEVAFGEYGLDSSLSTRIRHGRLQNHIRNVFQEYQLVNSKETYDSTKYIPDDQLGEVLVRQGCDRRSISAINNTFAVFSKNIDDIIEKINSSFIRIKTENLNPNGMFDLIFKEDELLMLFSDCNKINNEEIVLDNFEKLIIGRIEKGLSRIREYVKVQLKLQLTNFINEFEKEMAIHFEANKSSPFFQELKQKIANCRTGIQRETNKIAEWFKLPPKQDYSDFSIEQLMETCKAVSVRLNTFFNDVSVKIEDTSTSLIKGNTFSYFNEIFGILFTNATLHSGYLNDLKKLKINLAVNEDQNYIYFKMINNVSPQTDRDKLTQSIAMVRQRIKDTEDSKKYYNYEGGSGYVKIIKMLSFNIGASASLSFDLVEDDKYCVEIKLLKKGIVLEGESSENIVN